MIRRLPILLAAAAVTAQIAYPLVEGGPRDVLTIAVVTLLAAASITHATITRGADWAVGLVLVTAGLGLCSEVIGTATGIPYGCYQYSVERLGPAVAGVPLVVPLAWTAGFYPVWCAASRLARGGLPRTALTTIGVVGWDLYLDPQMVTDGQWSWCNTDAGLPGIEQIPLTNYAGWLVVAALMALVMDLVDRRSTAPTDPTDRQRDAVPLGLFLWTWLGSALAHSVFLTAPELRHSAIYGGIAMGILGVPLVVTLMRSRVRLPVGNHTPPPRFHDTTPRS
ncbi:MAG: carotenoid biosynthesis protein [Rhodococcus sp. (in: high G+C Gram-positive bacteria)]|uniref:carotenoid biosynthesis protein n=1 Tax=Rhodococcus sp. TaxID=1831 RepID=UPI003BB174AA